MYRPLKRWNQDNYKQINAISFLLGVIYTTRTLSRVVTLVLHISFHHLEVDFTTYLTKFSLNINWQINCSIIGVTVLTTQFSIISLTNEAQTNLIKKNDCIHKLVKTRNILKNAKSHAVVSIFNAWSAGLNIHVLYFKMNLLFHNLSKISNKQSTLWLLVLCILSYICDVIFTVYNPALLFVLL